MVFFFYYFEIEPLFDIIFTSNLKEVFHIMKNGSIVKGEITAIKPYGAFVKVGEQYDGLIHISEFSDGFVRSIDDYISVGDVIDLKVLNVNGSKLSLSFKELHKRKKRYNIVLEEGFSPLKEELVKWLNDYKFKSDE